MSAHGDKARLSKNQSVDKLVSQRMGESESTGHIIDNRPEAKQLMDLQAIANNYSQSLQMQEIADHYSAKQNNFIQRKEINNNLSNSTMPIQLLKDSEITAKVSVNGISKANVIRLRRNRPQYANGQVEAVWEASKNGDGKVICPNTGIELTWDKSKSRATQWHMGHKTGHEYNSLWESLATCALTYDQFLAEYQDPNNYQAEDPTANMSHAFEA